MRRLLQILCLCLALAAVPAARAQSYYVYANAESEDEVALIRFDGQTAGIAETIPVGTWPTEIEGPHGITVSPDGAYWYLTLAHGIPFGTLYKYSTATNEPLGHVELGLYPATMQVSKSTGLIYIVNFNLHGTMEPSTVSIVDPESMTEIERTETGIMPHGSRLSPDGMTHYSVAMMSDRLYELDALSFEVTRSLFLTPNDSASAAMEKPVSHAGMDHGAGHGASATQDHAAMGMSAVVKPTWVTPHPTEPIVYVALNGAAQVVEVNTDTWSVTRRFETEKGPYNLDVTPDGRRLVVTHKGAASIGVIDLESGERLAVLPTTRSVTHGVVITPDGRFAIATSEGVGSEPGAVDFFDLESLEHVTSVDIGKQAGGIAFWKMEEDS